MEIMVLIVWILMAILDFFKRPPLSNGLQSDLDQFVVSQALALGKWSAFQYHRPQSRGTIKGWYKFKLCTSAF